VHSLGLSAKDTVIIDRTTGIGQAILENAGDARVGVVVHADHYSVSGTDDTHILWNNYYEYPFDMCRHIDFFVTSTQAQADLMDRAVRPLRGRGAADRRDSRGELDHLTAHPTPRKPFSVVTASRLASEKHLDWVIEACVRARRGSRA
jgi:glycosyltransferase involved in cell wall biosynthesis